MEVITIESKAYQNLVKRIDGNTCYIATKDNSEGGFAKHVNRSITP